MVDTDIDQGFQRIANQYNMKLEEVRRYFANRDDLLPLMNELLSEKIINFLRDNAVLKPVSKDSQATIAEAAETEEK